MQAVLDGLQKALPAEQNLNAIAPSFDEIYDFETIAPKIRELRKLLEINDMEAVTLFSEIQMVLLAIDQINTTEMIGKLDAFDFKGALHNLQRIQGLLKDKNLRRK